MTSESTAVSHTHAVKAITQAAQNAYESLLQLQSVDDINPDGVFVHDTRGSGLHPQKAAHSYVLGYHYQLAKKSYWIKAKDNWQEDLTGDAGETYEATVPAEDEFTITTEDASTAVTLSDVETTAEPLSLESLSHRWSYRHVTINYKQESPYRERTTTTEKRRVWLPPRGMQLAFEQLENVRAKIGLGADIETPGWRSDEPV